MSGPTREQVVQWARDAGVQAPGGPNWEPFVSALERFAALAYAAGRAAEREAIAAWYNAEGWLLDEGDVPAAIRARGAK